MRCAIFGARSTSPPMGSWSIGIGSGMSSSSASSTSLSEKQSATASWTKASPSMLLPSLLSTIFSVSVDGGDTVTLRARTISCSGEPFCCITLSTNSAVLLRLPKLATPPWGACGSGEPRSLLLLSRLLLKFPPSSATATSVFGIDAKADAYDGAANVAVSSFGVLMSAASCSAMSCDDEGDVAVVKREATGGGGRCGGDVTTRVFRTTFTAFAAAEESELRSSTDFVEDVCSGDRGVVGTATTAADVAALWSHEVTAAAADADADNRDGEGGVANVALAATETGVLPALFSIPALLLLLLLLLLLPRSRTSAPSLGRTPGTAKRCEFTLPERVRVACASAGGINRASPAADVDGTEVARRSALCARGNGG